MCHRFFLGEILPEGSDYEVVIYPDCAVLGEKLRKLCAVNRKRFVGDKHLEGFAEDELLDESGLYGRVGFLHHSGEFIPFEIVKADFDMMAAFVCNRRSPAFTK